MLRRKFLAWLGALPIICDWKEALGYARPKRLVADQKSKDMYLAVEILRLINTVQLWNFREAGKRVALEHLHECIGYKNLMEGVPDRFRGVTEKFPADGSFQVNGYDIFVVPGTDPSKYLAAVSMKGPEYSFNFVTDELARIYQGLPPGAETGCAEMGKSLLDARAKERDTLAPAVETRWWPKLMATIMFSRFLGSSTPPQGQNYGCACCANSNYLFCTVPNGCVCDPECPSGCPSGESYCCVNCGTCTSCIWVRTTYCRVIGGCGCNESSCDVLECCFQGSGACICECG